MNLGPIENQNFNKGLKLLGIEDYTNVFTVEKFIKELEANKDEEILLFSNFPPNTYYQDHPDSQTISDTYGNGAPEDWKVPAYQVSAGLFSQVCQKYKFKAIHFITGAHLQQVSDSRIRSLTNQIPTTIKRKRDWFIKGANPDVMLRLYLLQKIKDELRKP
jgi:hypothetical protein